MQQEGNPEPVYHRSGSLCSACTREVKASELEAGLTPVTICMDGIAVIVNNDNAVEGLTLNQIRDIFTGEIVDWDEVK